MQNCPNCGSPIEPYKCKCDYCGTYYFDLTAFDITENIPYYIKFKTEQGIITALAKPSLETCELSTDTVDVGDGTGNIKYTVVSSIGCDLNVRFRCLVNPTSENKSLFTITIGE